MGFFHQRKCTNESCGLRFPVEAGSELGAKCPHCQGPTEFMDAPYVTHSATSETIQRPTRVVSVLLDNLRSLRNVGTIFRTADGAGIKHIYIAGITPTPEHSGLRKTALGSEQTVPWSYARDAVDQAAGLVRGGATLWALEGGSESASLFDITKSDIKSDLILVLGHEVSGVDPRVLALCERVVHIPMLGHKGSLNVAVAFGVAAYTLRFATSFSP